MIQRLKFLTLYFVFWIGCFESGRLLFLLYQWRNTARLDAGLIGGILVHGLRMDISLVCAVMIVPLCITARAGHLPIRAARRMIVGYTTVVLCMWALATVADLEVFKIWGYRLDSSPLHYLPNTREAVASSAGSPLLLLAALLVVLVALGMVTLSSALIPRFVAPPTGQLRSLLFVMVAAPGLTIGIRGGVNWVVPLTPGSVYFSRDNFANQAAVNPVWNFIWSALTGADAYEVDRFTDSKTAYAIVDSLVSEPQSATLSAPVLLARRPSRIVVLFWESFTAKIAEPLGGMRGITPGFTRLSRQGILFDNFYASGTRTTNGLVAGLAGFPTHPRTNPLASPEIGAVLPRLSTAIAANGYRTGFYYGGSLAFDNRNRFLLHGQYDQIVEKTDFPRATWESPWGVHDPVMLDRLFRALDRATGPLFAVTLTLSSHEPYDVPGPVLIPGASSEREFLNTQAYTDRAVSAFVDRAQHAPWWDSTLIIIMADHGHAYPAIEAPLAGAPSQFRIPMLWLGGALSVRDTVIHRVGSQTDLAPTLLAQLGIEHSQFRWSRNFLAPHGAEFAFYAFRDGFGYVEPGGSYVFDNVAKSVIYRLGVTPPAGLRAGRAFEQVVTQEYRALGAPTRSLAFNPHRATRPDPSLLGSTRR